MNYNNMINQIQQQLNQINNIYKELNGIKNQINNMNIDINSINLNNKLSLNNNININNNEYKEKFSVFFRQNDSDESYVIGCHDYDTLNTIISKYRNKSSDYSYNKRFFFNAKKLNIYSPLTIKN